MDLFRCPIFYFMSDSFTAPFSHHLSIELYRIIWCFIHFEFSTNPLFMLLYSNLWSYIELYEISNKTTIPSFILSQSPLNVLDLHACPDTVNIYDSIAYHISKVNCRILYFKYVTHKILKSSTFYGFLFAIRNPPYDLACFIIKR